MCGKGKGFAKLHQIRGSCHNTEGDIFDAEGKYFKRKLRIEGETGKERIKRIIQAEHIEIQKICRKTHQMVRTEQGAAQCERQTFSVFV